MDKALHWAGSSTIHVRTGGIKCRLLSVIGRRSDPPTSRSEAADSGSSSSIVLFIKVGVDRLQAPNRHEPIILPCVDLDIETVRKSFTKGDGPVRFPLRGPPLLGRFPSVRRRRVRRHRTGGQQDGQRPGAISQLHFVQNELTSALVSRYPRRAGACVPSCSLENAK